jgi:hypothetical protein
VRSSGTSTRPASPNADDEKDAKAEAALNFKDVDAVTDDEAPL